ncbi:polyamine ABC transporter substrate-binding protein [Nocardioides daeguensis]|uniref:Spermidine/putrescine ABC transporter substrate-binding protein n=1 Tax=Nocardioides daeguensis TaxID=908359 RepID=A0ABP6UTF1_9ACTN|nr:spermidine/putrescine ABC transporter substrate-binding protein [Nocardioides daeguensis]MBV6728292.1 spermidine/putrescine ABC transporter substrate-binding protein [Nocardioides daeguensis]MCR1773101.1 spermidine/putrescine ABC transporter substrate-binding protein [Nocardioides daeguensis]
MSRRTALRGGAGLLLGGASLGVLPLFGTPDRKQDPAECRVQDVSASDRRLVVSNWPGYIDEDDGDYVSTLTEFEKRTGIKVSYTADVNDNLEFFAKVVNQLGSCQSSKRDMFMLTDWMAARMIQVGWIQPLDKAKIPNVDANLIDSLRGVGWDPDRTYSAPWQSGLTGIAYNKSKVKEVRSFEELLTRSDLRGRISLLTEMRDTMGLIMLSQGKDPANFTQGDWDNAIERLRKARNDGQVRAFTGNDYIQDLSAGNILACEAWSGDVAAAEDENLVFVSPEEGQMIWSDNMLVPNLATHQGNAEEWINYYYEPEVAAKLAAYVWYICPVKGAQEAMEKVDPSLVENQLIFPSAESLKTMHSFMALEEFQIRAYEGDFADVIGG